MLSYFSHVWLYNPMDCSPPGSSVHGILHTRKLEWVAMPSPSGGLQSVKILNLYVVHLKLVWYVKQLRAVLYLVAQLCLTLFDATMDCSPPGSSVHGDSPGKNTGVGCHALLQGSSQPRDQTQVFHIVGEFFTVWATKEGQSNYMAICTQTK